MSSLRWLDQPPADAQWPDRVDSMLHLWLAARACTVASKTLRTDQDLLRLVPAAFLARDPRTLTTADLEAIFDHLRGRGLSPASVSRHRSSLSKFFGWMNTIGVLDAAPVLPTREVPESGLAPRPFSADELDQAWREWAERDASLADVMLVLARTGLRWSEARALRVDDFDPGAGTLQVDKAATEGTVPRSLPASLNREVPVAAQVSRTVQRLAQGRDASELLLTTRRGSQLHRTAVLRRLDWSHTGQGRRLHDLRHTAAGLWLAEGVDPHTVEGWMGHSLIVAGARITEAL